VIFVSFAPRQKHLNGLELKIMHVPYDGMSHMSATAFRWQCWIIRFTAQKICWKAAQLSECYCLPLFC